MPETRTEKPINFPAWEIRETRAGLKTQLLRPVKAPRDQGTGPDGARCGPMLYDLEHAFADHGFPMDDAGDPLGMDRWSGGSDPAPESMYRSHYLHVPYAHPLDGWPEDRSECGRKRVRCPYGAPGDRLWVREAWQDYCPIWHGYWCGHGTQEGIIRDHRPVYRADPESEWLRGPEGKQAPPCRWEAAKSMPRWASRLTLEITSVRVHRLHDLTEADILAEGVTVDRVARWCNYPWSSMPTLHYARQVLWYHEHGERWPWKSDPWCWGVGFKVVAVAKAAGGGGRTMIEKVVSGFQNGADIAGILAARAAGLATGGWMPKAFRTEGALRPDGTPGPDESHPEYAGLYGAREHSSRRYEDRTPLNVNEAEVTLLFGDMHSRGSKLAYHCFRRKIGEHGTRHDPGITYIRDGWIPIHRWPTSGDLNLTPAEVAGILGKMPHRVVNVAGNRESSKPGIGAWVEAFLAEVFRRLKEQGDA